MLVPAKNETFNNPQIQFHFYNDADIQIHEIPSKPCQLTSTAKKNEGGVQFSKTNLTKKLFERSIH